MVRPDDQVCVGNELTQRALNRSIVIIETNGVFHIGDNVKAETKIHIYCCKVCGANRSPDYMLRSLQR